MLQGLHKFIEITALIIVSAICRPGLKPQAIYCRVDKRMIKAEITVNREPATVHGHTQDL